MQDYIYSVIAFVAMAIHLIINFDMLPGRRGCGTAYGLRYRGMVREIVAELRRNFGDDFRLVATGGFARWVLRDVDMPFSLDSTLTLYGAGLVAVRALNIGTRR